MWIQPIAWLATATSFAGIWTVSKGDPSQMARGMLLYLVGSILWGLYGLATEQWHLFLLNCGYIAVEWRAFKRWKEHAINR